MKDWNALANFCDEEETLANYFNRTTDRVIYNIFRNQEDLLYMVNETSNGVPKYKEGAIRKIYDMACGELAVFIECLIGSIIRHDRFSNIELSDEMIEWLIEDMTEEGYNEWEQQAREYIFKDYAHIIGEDKAKELAVKWWGENNGIC